MCTVLRGLNIVIRYPSNRRLGFVALITSATES